MTCRHHHIICERQDNGLRLMICTKCRRKWLELPLDPYTELSPSKAWGGMW